MIELEGITELLIYALAMVLGAIMAVVIPYILKVWIDDSIKFDKRYFAVLLFAVLLAVFFNLPATVDVVNLTILRGAVVGGYGVAAFVRDIAHGIIEKGEAGKPA